MAIDERTGEAGEDQPLPDPPYHAVIFTTQQTDSLDGYEEMAAQMVTLAKAQPGFLGIESARNPDGSGITVSYWASEDAITSWKANVDHLAAQRQGKEQWYADYITRVAVVQRQYEGPSGR